MRVPFLLLTIVLTGVISCKKNTDVNGRPQTTPTTGAKIDFLKDSVYLYTKEVYLWSDVIPSYDQFNPRRYTASTEVLTGQAVMDGIRALQPLDRFSFVTTQEESNGLQTGEDRDYGFFVKSAYIDKTLPYDSVSWFVSYVYDKSSAAAAGVQRSWIVDRINGTKIDNSNSSIDLLNDIFFGNGTSASFQFVKPDGSSTGAISLSKTSFTANSVLYRNVISAGSKKVGYLVFNQFFAQPSRTELGNAFSFFQSQGISELVVDLRYNRGGSTQTQDTLANLIAPTSANGKLMYKYVYNSTLQRNQHTLIRNKLGYGNIFQESNNSQNFAKAGSMNLSRVFFIVTSSSASASELLINNLKPYMDVKLIGDTTYGKPVGFFPIQVFDYAIYPISFKTVNSSGNADYYTGFAPDALAADGVSKAWGDISEPSLQAALKYINSGSFRESASENERQRLQASAQETLEPALRKVENRKFSGMFEEK